MFFVWWNASSNVGLGGVDGCSTWDAQKIILIESFQTKKELLDSDINCQRYGWHTIMQCFLCGEMHHPM